MSGNIIANINSSSSTNTWSSPTTLCYFYSGSYKDYLGNYYGDYGGSDGGGGIGSTPYELPGSEPDDGYPLMQTAGNYTVQAWYLHSDDNTMYEANMGKGQGSVAIGAGGSHTWVSDQAATYGVTFSSDTWTGQVVFTESVTGSDFTVYVGYADSDGSNFNSGPQATLSGTGTTFTYTTNSASLTVPSGKHLALQINNSSGSSRSIATGGAWSYTSNPDTGAPDYPVPEMSTIVLLSSGLVVLAGYVWWWRGRRTTLGGD